MSELKRYSLLCGTDSVLVPTHVHEVELDDGAYCRYEDVERILNILNDHWQRVYTEQVKQTTQLRTCIEEDHDYGKRGHNIYCKRCGHRRRS